jgi:hypothetical protein
VPDDSAPRRGEGIALKACVLALALLLSGCVTHTTVVKVKADGSGTVEMTATIKAEFAKNLKIAVKAAQKKLGTGPPDPVEFFGLDELKGRAGKMGEGVTFVSAEPVRTDKEEGVTAVYAFGDVNKLALINRPFKVGGDDALQANVDPRHQVTFRLARQGDGRVALTAVFPDNARPDSQAGGSAAPSAPLDLRAVLPLVAGLKYELHLEPEGTLVRSEMEAGPGNRVALVKVDVDRIARDEASVQKLAITQGKGLRDSHTLLEGMPGLLLPPGTEVTVEFKGK